jgi:hypothetical protein
MGSAIELVDLYCLEDVTGLAGPPRLVEEVALADFQRCVEEAGLAGSQHFVEEAGSAGSAVAVELPLPAEPLLSLEKMWRQIPPATEPWAFQI